MNLYLKHYSKVIAFVLGSNNPVESYVSGGGPGNMHVDTFQRLPDFLSDGHVHSSSAAARQPNSNINNNSRAEPLAEHPVELVSELDVTAAGNTNAVTRTLVNSLQLENLRLVGIVDFLFVYNANHSLNNC